MPAQDRKFWVFGKNIFEAEGEPIGHAVAHAEEARPLGCEQYCSPGLGAEALSAGPCRFARDRRMPRAEGSAEGVERSLDALLRLPAPFAPITPSPQNCALAGKPATRLKKRATPAILTTLPMVALYSPHAVRRNVLIFCLHLLLDGSPFLTPATARARWPAPFP